VFTAVDAGALVFARRVAPAVAAFDAVLAVPDVFDRVAVARGVVARAVRDAGRPDARPAAAPFRGAAPRADVPVRALVLTVLLSRAGLAAVAERVVRGVVLRVDVPRAVVARAVVAREAVVRAVVVRALVVRPVVVRPVVVRPVVVRAGPDFRAGAADRAGAARAVFAVEACGRVFARDAEPVVVFVAAAARETFGAARFVAFAAVVALLRAGAFGDVDRAEAFAVDRPAALTVARPVLPAPPRVVAVRRPPSRTAIAFEPEEVSFVSSLLM
jgi:hypothetical protein